LTRRHIRGILQIIVSAVLMALVLRQVHWREVAAAVRGMNVAWLAGAWLLYLLGFAVRAVRWQVLLAALGIRRPLHELTLWYLVGGFFNVILPTGFGGDAVRVVELAQDTAPTGAGATARAPDGAGATGAGAAGPVLNSVVVDRYLGLIVLLAMGLAAGLLRPDLASGPVFALMALLFAGGIAAAWLLSRPWWQRRAADTGWLSRLVRASKLPAIAGGLGQYGRDALLRGLAASLVFNLLQIGWNAAIATGLGLHLPAALYFVFVPLTSVALLLPAFGGLGVRELTYVTLLAASGVAEPQALALSLGVYAITVATGLVGGVLYLAQGLRRAGVRRASRAQRKA
jgi:glycosyltransferase 2 family protein